MSENPTWEGLGQGMLVLAALWWAWGAYAWLTNYIDTEQDRERLLMLGAMAAMLVAALATPHVFGDDALIFGVAYAGVRWLHIFIFAEANEHVDTATAVRVLARTALPAPLLLIGAAFFDGSAQALIWIVALSIDFGGPFVFGVRGFRVSAGHFAERFGLIVIIALGESIVAIGAGIAGVELDTGLVVAAVFGVALSAALWWAYFDMTALLSEEHFRHLQGEERLLVARDAYSYLHLPLIAGILLVALGVRRRSAMSTSRSRPCRRSRSSAASPSTTQQTSPSGCGSRTRSAQSGSWPRRSASRSSPSRRRSTRLRPLASQPRSPRS